VPAIRILVVDDHEVIRGKIAELLSTRQDFNVVGLACNGIEAVRKAKECQPDVVLLDISLPDLSGLQAAPLIKKAAPQVEILIITSYDSLFAVRAAFSAGARGFLPKAEISAELIAAVTDVYSKRQFISKNLRKSMACDPPPVPLPVPRNPQLP
jgi:DNA-binding NarL/FixJ family response regulator